MSKQKKKFDKEYNNFLLSEFILEKMEEENISVRELARKAEVSPTIIQKLRNNKIPIIARIHKGNLIFDIRTIFENEFCIIKDALNSLIGE